MRGGSSVTPSGSPSGRSTSYSIASLVGSLAWSRKRSSAVRNSQSRKSSSERPLTAWSSVPGTSPNAAPSESGATEWTRITAATPTFKEFVKPGVATSTPAESSEHVNMKASRPRRQPAGGSQLAAERATGFEPATSSLGSWHSTPELRPRGYHATTAQRLQTTSNLATSCFTRYSTATAHASLLLCQDDLWQRRPRAGLAEGVVGVDHCRPAAARIDGDLEQVEQIARSPAATSALGADDADVIWRVAHEALVEGGAVVCRLRQENVPDCRGVVFARRGGAVVDKVHDAIPRGDPRKYRGGCWRAVDGQRRRPADPLITGRCVEDSVRVGPCGVQLATGGIHGQRGEDVVLRRIERRVEDERGPPGHATVGAARDENVVEVRRRPFLDTGLAGRVDVVHVVGEHIGDDGSLVVIEGGVAGDPALPDDRVAHALPREAVVVGALEVNQRAAARIVVGDEHARAVGRGPGAVGFGQVDDLRLATGRAEVAAAFRQVMAETPSWPGRMVGVARKISVVRGSVPVEPQATSASSPPTSTV